MKKLIDYIKDFVRQDYNFATYFSILVFLSLSITINYLFHVETDLINPLESGLLRFFIYLSLYSFAYYSTLLLFLFSKNKNFFSNRTLLLKSFTALSIVALDRAFFLSSEGLQSLMNTVSIHEADYLIRILNIFVPWAFYLLFFLFTFQKYDRQSSSFYGLSFKRFDWKPYFLMLLCMIALLWVASFTSHFTTQYPFFKYWNYEPVFGLTQIQMFSLYESFYLVNFINIELLFRGMLVIGMARYMGKEAILPMVVVYAFIHFGKPCAETISSVFGGYILGVFAHRSENIIGGIFIHISIAFLMDLFAILQLHWQNG